MDIDPAKLASLAVLLRAELLAQPHPAAAIQQRYRLSSLFQSRRRQVHAALSQAMAIASVAATSRLKTAGTRPDTESTGAKGSVLLVCESQPFEPNLDSLCDQLQLRLLTGVEAAGMAGWILRLRTRPRSLRRQLGQLPARPAVIVSVGVSDQACLELLRELAPVARLGMRSTAIRRIACVEYDARLEAGEIASYAATHKMEQIAFVGCIDRVAGRRRISARDIAVLSALAVQAHGPNIAVPSALTFWIDAGRDLRSAGVLSKIAAHTESRVLAAVSGVGWARELARAAGTGAGQIVCRHWSAEGAGGLPVIGPDLEQLARVLLARALGQDHLPTEAAVLVPPVWHGE
jgi:hypothetical protein